MKYETTSGDIVYPKPPKGPPKVYTFEVYYMENLAQYISLLGKKCARLLSVVQAWYANGISRGWVVTYIHHEPIEMEVWC